MGFRQVRRRIRRVWKTKTIPILPRNQTKCLGLNGNTQAHRELKRRKLLVINGILNPGRPIYFEDLLSGGRSSNSSIFSVGMTCCRSLRRRLARHICRIGRIDMAHLVRRRSCNEKPVSLLLLAPSCSFSFSLELEIDSRSLLRLLSGSGDGDPVVPEKARRGTGSSLLTNASAVFSSMSNANCSLWLWLFLPTPDHQLMWAMMDGRGVVGAEVQSGLVWYSLRKHCSCMSLVHDVFLRHRFV